MASPQQVDNGGAKFASTVCMSAVSVRLPSVCVRRMQVGWLHCVRLLSNYHVSLCLRICVHGMCVLAVCTQVFSILFMCMCLVYLPVSTGRKSVFFRLLCLGYAPRRFVPVSTAYAYCVRLSTLYNSQPCMSSLRVRLESAADLCKSMCAS